MRPFAFYSFMRILVFAGTLLALYAVGARGWLLVVLALLISAGLAYLLLKQQRDKVANVIADRVDRKQATKFEHRIDRANAEEDEAAGRQER